jgi:hypothetical protein
MHISAFTSYEPCTQLHICVCTHTYVHTIMQPKPSYEPCTQPYATAKLLHTIVLIHTHSIHIHTYVLCRFPIRLALSLMPRPRHSLTLHTAVRRRNHTRTALQQPCPKISTRLATGRTHLSQLFDFARSHNTGGNIISYHIFNPCSVLDGVTLTSSPRASATVQPTVLRVCFRCQ